MKKSTISIHAEDSVLLRALKGMVPRHWFQIIESSTIGDLARSLQHSAPDLVIIGSSQKGPGNSLEIAREVRRHSQKMPIILVTSHSSEELAIGALKIGVMDYLKLPLLPEDLMASINRGLSFTTLESSARGGSPGLNANDEEQMVGSSLLGITSSLQKIALTDCTVLITGETGTGKELAARLIHRCSTRSQKPFVVINCVAIPDTLLESELFGYERGAFTGAYSRQKGALQMAESGSVFFDEIGDMIPYAQAKILRTMESREVCPIGGRSSRSLDVRFIIATNRDLEQLVEEGKFRSDLYFRINVARIHLPPLRERQGDIVLLLDYFRKKFNRLQRLEIVGFSEEALAALTAYDWPGNIRELKNLLEATFIHARQKITFNDFPELFRRRLKETGGQSRDERTLLMAALLNTNCNKTKAAQQLHWSRMTLYRKMEKYKINSPLAVSGN